MKICNECGVTYHPVEVLGKKFCHHCWQHAKITARENNPRLQEAKCPLFLTEVAVELMEKKSSQVIYRLVRG